MEAVITSRFCSGLGDMHVGLYQIYTLQQELKSIGYNFLSHCSKIYGMADWFSAFLSFACLYKQTSTLNLNRFN